MDVLVRPSSLLLVFLVLVGCQTTDPSIELLESELRWMEDQMYSLDRELDQRGQQLASARNSNRALRRELSDAKRPSDSPTPAGSPGSSADDDLTPPAVIVPSADEFDEESLKVPRIDFGPNSDIDDLDPIPDPIPIPDPGSSESPSDAEEPPPIEERDNITRRGDVDVRVERIALNSRLTGGYDFDGKPGDEGLLVVIEPQNASGQYVPLPGDLVIEVTDPRRDGPEHLVARWQFDSSETVSSIKKSLLGRGMHLQLPWPDQVPTTEKLVVKVQYKPSTGPKLVAERQFRVDLVARRQPSRNHRSALLPDRFVPTRPPRLSQLLSDQTLTMPTAPRTPRSEADLLNGRSDRKIRIPQTAIRRAPIRATRVPRPRWRPYR